ncbi:MAG: HlyD family efflux transporter periplasmic adaptor subunit [Rubrivivax sp.]|nr:HlyD family efflux transporter periplasmic adaptor subunit [Rubrivivax sp.]
MLHSPDWYRVAALKLRLRPGVTVSRQVVRGQVWQVLTDPSTGRQHRFNEPAWRLIAALDGELTLDEVWRRGLAADGDAAATQPEALRVVAQAYAARLLLGRVAPDAAALVKVQRERRGQQRRAAVNPLAFKLPLWNPDAFLERWIARVAPWIGRPVRLLGWAVACLGLLLLMAHGPELARDAQAHTGSMRLMLIMWLAWPLMKGLHEMAHAFVLKSRGAQVPEIGVTLMVLTPLPYVDASASAALANKRDRIAVAAAGILVESVIASLALALWLVLEPGLAREICLALVLVGGLSTLLVNGNPLMRYDGYHVLADALELPNLAPRSLRWWQLQLQRRLLGRREAIMTDLAPGERPWLLAYAPLSWLWRVGLLVVLAIGLSHWSQLLGIALLLLALWTALIGPLWKSLRWIWRAPEAAGRRVKAGAALATGAALGIAAVLILPVADRSHAPGIVWLPDEAFVRLHTDARVEAFLVDDGADVAAGTPLVQLANEELVAELSRARSQWRSAQIERLQRFDNDAGRTALAEDDIRRLQAEAERLQAQVDQLTLRSAVAGRVVLAAPQRVLGRWLSQGDQVAQVLTPGAARVRALVRNEDVARVRAQPGEIGVRLAHDQGPPQPAVIERAVPRATRELPSAAFGERAGGPLRTDPADSSGRTAAEARFVVDLRLPEGVEARVGTRALVSFEHGHTVAAAVLARLARQTFLRHFSA